MCGIFMTVSKSVDEDFMSDMFVMDALRGKDSCGLISITNNEADTFKRAVSAVDFIDMKSYTTNFWANTKAAVGHNRAATKGAVNSLNAHPFTCGNITGVHNGTLRGQWRLDDNQDFEVDSENIFHDINKNGIEDTWSRIDGAAALMYWNDEDKTLNVIRNEERPLFMTKSITDNFFLASEKFMLLAAMARQGIKWTDVEPVPTDTLLSFNTETTEVTSKKLKGLVKEVYYPEYDGGGYGQYLYPRGQSSGNRLENKSSVLFEVDQKIKRAGETLYYCSGIGEDNKNAFYSIRDYGDVLQLEEESTGTSTIMYSANDEVFLSIKDLVMDMSPSEEEEDEDKPPSTCDNCLSVLRKGEIMVVDSEGNTYCPDCASDSYIKEYIGNSTTEVVTQ